MNSPLWDWMNERHRIYLAKRDGLPKPWTSDPIMQQYRFCNVFRELDTVTIWIRDNIRKPYRQHPNLWFMLAIARQINLPSTLQDMMDGGVWPTGKEWDAVGAAQIMNARMKAGLPVYTGAYMIRAESDPNKPWYKWTKQEYMTKIVLGRPWEARSTWEHFDTLQAAHQWFLKFHGWGPFMSYEVVTDLRWTRELINAKDIYTWANAGPGALRGLNRLHVRPLNAPLSQTQACQEMLELLVEANSGRAELGLHLPVPLEMRDIEHSLCETDKWLRVRFGEGRPRAKYNGVK